MKLFSVSNPKTDKSVKYGWLTAVLHLAPHDLAIPGKSVCPWATVECKAHCLHTAGNPVYMEQKTKARNFRTELFFTSRQAFLMLLVRETEAFIRKAKRKGLRPAIRLNGTSDLPYEKYSVTRAGVVYSNMFTAFPEVQFYDYTKSEGRAVSVIYPNYHLTYSLNIDSSDGIAAQVKSLGGNVAVIYQKGDKKTIHDLIDDNSVDYVDGDIHDLTFLHTGQSIMLKAKGKARE